MVGNGNVGFFTLHCFAVFLTRREEIRAHWFFPYLSFGDRVD